MAHHELVSFRAYMRPFEAEEGGLNVHDCDENTIEDDDDARGACDDTRAAALSTVMRAVAQPVYEPGRCGYANRLVHRPNAFHSSSLPTLMAWHLLRNLPA